MTNARTGQMIMIRGRKPGGRFKKASEGHRKAVFYAQSAPKIGMAAVAGGRARKWLAQNARMSNIGAEMRTIGEKSSIGQKK